MEEKLTVYLLVLANRINSDYVILSIGDNLKDVEKIGATYPLTENQYLYIEERKLNQKPNRIIEKIEDYHFINEDYFKENENLFLLD